MKERRILFNVSFIYHKPNFSPLMEVFKEDNRYKVYASCENERERRFLFLDISRRKECENEIMRDGIEIIREKEGFCGVITGDTIRDAKNYMPTKFFYIGHGTAIKTVVYNNLNKFKDTEYIIFPEGEYVKEQYKRFLKGTKSIIEEPIGSIKLDPIFRNKFDREAIVSRLGIKNKRPIVLYAPTYKPTSIFHLTKKDAIFKITEEYNLIVKLHHYSWMGKYAPHRQHRIFERKLKEYNFYLVPKEEYNILPYLYIADVLITEASSVMSDFIALEKPVVIYDLPIDEQTRSDGSLMLEEPNYELFRDVFFHISSPDELFSGIKSALYMEEKRKKRLREYAEYMFAYRDGRSAIRCKNRIDDILGDVL
jgi:hypothetical protein